MSDSNEPSPIVPENNEAGAKPVDNLVDGGTRNKSQVSQPSPLSWKEARSTLRTVMEYYMETPLPVVKSVNTPNQQATTKWWECLFEWDIDFFVGAAVSTTLLGLSIASLATRNHGKIGMDAALNAAASLTIYRAQVAASTLFLFGSFFCVFLVKRREYTFAHDSDVSKRKTLAKFLRSTENCDDESVVTGNQKSNGEDIRQSKTNSQDSPEKQLPQLHHSGTSRTGIYPAYRLSESNEAFWFRIPTLLLVKGDYVALQVGDVAPARCKLLTDDAQRSSTAPCIIEGGERITTSSFGDLWGLSPSFQFPPGKSTVPSDSRQLLELCNHMSVFVLEETPLESFLRLPNAKQRLPQVHRQLRVIRHVMFVFAVMVFVVSFVIILVRPGILSSDLSVVIHTPLLASLASLPVVAPACMFFLEILGLARILVKVHPYAFTSSSKDTTESSTRLFLRYILAATSSRLFLQGRPSRLICSKWTRLFGSCRDDNRYDSDEPDKKNPDLICIPPASTFLLEKLGVATAFTLIDDELACEPFSIPQQLLIPSSNGLKLLDLCPTYETDSEDESDDERPTSRKRGRSYGSSPDSDSDSDDEHRFNPTTVPKRKIKSIRKRRMRRKVRANKDESEKDNQQDGTTLDDTDVQFEDPLWWHFLPSLKCIGLASLLVDGTENKAPPSRIAEDPTLNGQSSSGSSPGFQKAENALVRHVCSERERLQLQSLARCIGFVTSPNSAGEHGDLSYFEEKLRVNVVSTKLLDERMAMDAHALGLEESRSWGLLQPDSSSVIVQDKRSKAYQLLSLGDPRVIASLCHEAWQGENSTILPLNAVDRTNVIQTSTNWLLSDLDVAAFAYSPVRSTLETQLSGASEGSDTCKTMYIVENSSKTPSKDRVSEDWALINNQIFLGVLGSSIIPRKEIEKLLEIFDEAGVRFVYFSPRNMRRTKELASQIGIDVAWNCAISLRDLDEGEEDPHRMVSAYADWSVNAKLPHGIVNVRKHLKEVDNVPLLVSLFTDATKESTREMIETFQEYHDNVLTMGLSHLKRNAGIFSTADISVGADVLAEELAAMPSSADSLLPQEVEFVASISSHSCAFNLRGAASSSLMPCIIERGRTALEAALHATLFVLYGTVAFSLYACFCMCAVSTAVPFVPTLGSVLYLQIVLPLVSLGLAMSDSDEQSMHRVPPKNDQSLTFSRNEGKRLYTNTLLKALLPAVLTQVLYLIAFGELMIRFEPEILRRDCGMSIVDLENNRWTMVIRCQALQDYSGVTRTSSGSLILAEMVLCVLISSASFVHATLPVVNVPLWQRNRPWIFLSLLGIILVAIYLVVSLERGSFAALSWYFFFLAAIIPFLCLLGNELIKRSERKHIDRAAKLRRLQFETRLGMWSPK